MRSIHQDTKDKKIKRGETEKTQRVRDSRTSQARQPNDSLPGRTSAPTIVPGQPGTLCRLDKFSTGEVIGAGRPTVRLTADDFSQQFFHASLPLDAIVGHGARRGDRHEKERRPRDRGAVLAHSVKVGSRCAAGVTRAST
jgi:hypothetical protein